VSVFCFDDDGVLLASGGGVVAAPGRVVTSLSLVQHAKVVVVQGSRQWEAEVDGWRGLWSLARLDVAGCELPAFGFRASRTLRPGESLYRAGVRDGSARHHRHRLSDLTRFSGGGRRALVLLGAPTTRPGGAPRPRGPPGRAGAPHQPAAADAAAPEWAGPSPPTRSWPRTSWRAPLHDAILSREAIHGQKADCPSLVGALGDALQSLEQHEMALPSFRHAIRLDPENPWPHHALGLSLARLGRFEEAASELAEAVRLEPGNEAYARGLRIFARTEPEA
jgi:hypothetical protein